jgi:RimJ/RimL family protein N-acetyltransferase
MLATERLIIRNFRKSDWKDLYAYLSLAETYAFEPGEPVTARGAKRLARIRAKTDSFLAVVRKSDDRMIGHLYLGRTEPPEFNTWELGYIFNPVYRNQGFCTEAARRAMEYSFTDLRAHKVVAFCDPRNPASWHVLENIGLKREGHFKAQAFFRKDAEGYPDWHDAYAYGLTERDWFDPSFT